MTVAVELVPAANLLDAGTETRSAVVPLAAVQFTLYEPSPPTLILTASIQAVVPAAFVGSQTVPAAAAGSTEPLNVTVAPVATVAVVGAIVTFGLTRIVTIADAAVWVMGVPAEK